MGCRLIVGASIALVTAAALLIAACGGSSDPTPTPEQPAATSTAVATTPAPQPTTVATPEEPEEITVATESRSIAGGEISISMPPSALPVGVSASELEIRNVSADDLIVSVEDAEVVAAYRLLPDGLELSEPAAVTLRLPAASVSSGLALLHLTSEGPSSLGPVAVTIDDAGEMVTVQTTVTHFSDLYALQVGFFTVEVTVAKNSFKVGETFGAAAQVRPTGATFSLSSEGSGTVYTTDSVYVDGFWTGHQPAITPDLVRDRPSYAVLGALYEHNQLFVCEEETTSVSVAYHVQIEYGFERTITADDGSKTTEIAAVFGLTTIDLVDSEPINCVPVPPIQADFFDLGDGSFTTYKVDVDADSGASFAWSGPDCGSNDASDQPMMTWFHGTEDCKHAVDSHITTTIAVVVTGADFKVRCTYAGTDTGFGPLCEKAE